MCFPYFTCEKHRTKLHSQGLTHHCKFDFDYGFIKVVIKKKETVKRKNSQRMNKYC